MESKIEKTHDDLTAEVNAQQDMFSSVIDTGLNNVLTNNRIANNYVSILTVIEHF